MARYKPLVKYACFNCRKCFKRPSLWTLAASIVPQGKPLAESLAAFEASYLNPCPDCGLPTAFVGEAFKAPRHSDIRTWARLQAIYAQRREMALDAQRLWLKHDDLWYAYR